MTLLVLLAAVPLPTLARDAREQARIDHLLDCVEKSEGLTFVRNGAKHDGATAARHLRDKLRAAGERVQTAEDFVKYCASESSLTQRKYLIELADGTVVEAATFFTSKLREFDAQKR